MTIWNFKFNFLHCSNNPLSSHLLSFSRHICMSKQFLFLCCLAQDAILIAEEFLENDASTTFRLAIDCVFFGLTNWIIVLVTIKKFLIFRWMERCTRWSLLTQPAKKSTSEWENCFITKQTVSSYATTFQIETRSTTSFLNGFQNWKELIDGRFQSSSLVR